MHDAYQEYLAIVTARDKARHHTTWHGYCVSLTFWLTYYLPPDTLTQYKTGAR